MIKSFFNRILTSKTDKEQNQNDPVVLYVKRLISSNNPGNNLKKKLEETTFTIIDTETTGLDEKRDKILSIAAVKVKNIRIIDIYNVFIDAGVKIPAESVKFHGILDKDLKNKPKIYEILPDFIRFLNNSIIVGHHIKFDVKMLNKDIFSYFNVKLNNYLIDTGHLYNFVSNNEGNVSLDFLMEKYNVKCEEENRHSAIGDAIATAEVFIKILNILKDKLKYIEDFYHNGLILKV